MGKFNIFPSILRAITSEATDEDANAISIAAIPQEQLPDKEARQELYRRAMAGDEVYAYRPAFQEQWVLWIREGRPDQEMRHVPAEWAANWRKGREHDTAE